MTRGVIVWDRVLALGYEPTKSLMRAVGHLLQRRYAAKHERQPPKILAPKTNVVGSHCFAIYPYAWVPVIDETIRQCAALLWSGRQP